MASCDAVLETLSKLSISPNTVSHDAVADNKIWTTTLSGSAPNVAYQVTKTLIFKPKTAKTATPTPVVVVALETTETNATALGKKLSLKDCRFANEDLLKDTFGVTKEAVSPFSLANVADLSLVHLVVDAALLASTDKLTFHPATSDKTVFITADELKNYFKSINKEFIEVDFKALAAAKPPAAAPKPKAKAAKAAKPAKKEGNVFGINSGYSFFLLTNIYINSCCW
jgi:prolyl-tRNA synthetase